MVKIDVVMLSNTADADYLQMTQKAISTLQQLGFDWQVVLVETNPGAVYWYDGRPNVTVITPDEPFNYNRFLNYGFKQGRDDAQMVVVCNNDIVAEDWWFSPIYQAIKTGELDSASPRAPGWWCHDGYAKLGIRHGYRVSYEFCGWCWVISKMELDKLLPLDETFVFESQDQDLCERMKALGIRHGIVLDSKVKHLLNKSHKLIPTERRDEMFEGCHRRYKEKYG